MVAADRRRAEKALDWVRRIHDPSFSDWEAHALWLEADPLNLAVFDDASFAIESAVANLAPPLRRPASPTSMNDNMPEPVVVSRSSPRWIAGLGVAIAAGIVAVIFVPTLMRGGAQPYVLETGAGQHRSVTLADGTTIALNGGTSVRLDRRDARIANVDQGEAFFIVTHDAAHPFVVHAGDAAFKDVGTAFDVVRDTSSVQVAVREGAVLYDPGGASVRVGGGQSIRIADDSATLGPTDAASVGGWRAGRLVYRDAAIGEVAGDVARNIGEPISVDPALAQRRFSGVVVIDPDRTLMLRRMAGAMNVEIQHTPNGWRMVMPLR